MFEAEVCVIGLQSIDNPYPVQSNPYIVLIYSQLRSQNNGLDLVHPSMELYKMDWIVKCWIGNESIFKIFYGLDWIIHGFGIDLVS